MLVLSTVVCIAGVLLSWWWKWKILVFTIKGNICVTEHCVKIWLNKTQKHSFRKRILNILMIYKGVFCGMAAMKGCVTISLLTDVHLSFHSQFVWGNEIQLCCWNHCSLFLPTSFPSQFTYHYQSLTSCTQLHHIDCSVKLRKRL